MIGYYVHHHGSGHLTRARTIAEACSEPVVALSSLPEPVTHPFAGWVTLADDPWSADAADPTACGALHWAPLNSPGFRDRMSKIAHWISTHRPRLVVVDVSAEVTVLVRSLGVPVVAMAVPGNRDDPAHETALRMSSLVIATWPREVYDPLWLRPAGRRVVYVGALSRFDDRHELSSSTPSSVQLLGGFGGGGADPSRAVEVERATGWRCGVGTGTWGEDVWQQLCSAEVVITHAGSNALAETAAARRAAVVVPAARPFDEQVVVARALDRAGLATVLDSWPHPARWPTILAEARLRGGAGWKAWNDGQAAPRISRCLAEVVS